MSDEDDDRILAEAQRRLEANREELRRRRAASAPMELAAQKVISTRAAPNLRPPMALPRRPGAQLQRTATLERAFAIGKGGLLYDVPEGPFEEADISPSAIERRVRETIPAAFQGVTWETLARLRNTEGQPSLGVIESIHGMPMPGGAVRGLAAVQRARESIERSQKVVIFGPTRVGKTLLAVAALEDELRRGNDRARWVHAPTLRDPEVMAKALSSSFLVLDDLGYELDGAPEGSALLSQKRGPMCDFLGRWYLRRDARLVITTWMGHAAVSGAYGDGAAARIYEGANTIVLRKD